MKKKGFTLIELLAVIVILAIIALIATPIVMNTIENSKKGAAERSAENYMDAVETAVAEERIDNVILEGEYTIQEDGSLCPKAGCGEDDKDKVSIEMSGNKPTSGTIFIQNGLVTTNSTMSFADNYEVSYDSTKGSYVAEKEESEANTTTTVYRLSTDTIGIGARIDLTDTNKFKTDSTTLGNDVYLRHVVENNIVTETWACAVLNGEPACVRGGVDANGNSYYNENKLILEGLNDELNCSSNASSSRCDYGSVSLSADSSGYVDASGASDYCRLYDNDDSYCRIN